MTQANNPSACGNALGPNSLAINLESLWLLGPAPRPLTDQVKAVVR